MDGAPDFDHADHLHVALEIYLVVAPHAEIVAFEFPAEADQELDAFPGAADLGFVQSYFGSSLFAFHAASRVHVLCFPLSFAIDLTAVHD